MHAPFTSGSEQLRQTRESDPGHRYFFTAGSLLSEVDLCWFAVHADQSRAIYPYNRE